MRLSGWQRNLCGVTAHNSIGIFTAITLRPAKPLQIAGHGDRKLQTRGVGYTDICHAYPAEAAHISVAKGQQHTKAAGLDSPTAQVPNTSTHAAEDQQQVLQSIIQPCMQVQLLQQAAMVNSWPAAQQLLCQHGSQLQQAHVGLLWWQLRPKLLHRRQQHTCTELQLLRTRQRGGQLARTPSQPYSAAEERLIKQDQLHQQQQQHVLQMLLGVTMHHADELSPQSLAYTIQGVAAAAAAGLVSFSAVLVPEQNRQKQQQQQKTRVKIQPSSKEALLPAAVLHLPATLPALLWRRLMSLASTCTAQQLSHCIAGGQQLGWKLDSTGGGSSSSKDTMVTTTASSSSSTATTLVASSAELCCWPVLEQALSGVLGTSLQRRQPPEAQIDSSEGGQLLHALAGYVQQQRLQQLHGLPEQQQQQQVRQPGFKQLLQRLADKACSMTAEQQQALRTTYMLGQEGWQPISNHSCNLNSQSSVSQENGAAVACTSSPVKRAHNSRPSSSQLLSADAVASVICSLQAAALLQVLPNTQKLEALLQQLELQLQDMPAMQVMQLLQALSDLHIEPWQSWLVICYSRVKSDMHLLQPQQLVQLLQLLPQITRLQPDRQMLSSLAKLTAVHATRFSWRQLAVLPLGFAAVGFRPEAYWLKDYVAASSLHVQQGQWQHKQEQQLRLPGQVQVQMQLLANMVLGVSWLAAAAAVGPPAAWLAAVEQQLVAALSAVRDASGIAISSAAGNSAAVCHDGPVLETPVRDASSGVGPATCMMEACLSSTTHSPACTHHQHHRQRVQEQQWLSGVLSAETASMVLTAFAQMRHNPSLQLQQLLQCAGCVTRDTPTCSSSPDSRADGASSSPDSRADGASSSPDSRADGTSSSPDSRADGTSSSPDSRADGASSSPDSRADGASSSPDSRADGASSSPDSRADGASSSTSLPISRRRYRHRSSSDGCSSSMDSTGAPRLRVAQPPLACGSALLQPQHAHLPALDQQRAATVQLPPEQQQQQGGRNQSPQMLGQSGHLPGSTMPVQLLSHLEHLGLGPGEETQSNQGSLCRGLHSSPASTGRSSAQLTEDLPMQSHHQFNEAMLAAS